MRRTAPLGLVPIWLAVMTSIIFVSSLISLAPPVSAEEPEPLTLTPPGKAEAELGFLYSHFSKNRLVVNGYSFYDVIIIGKLMVHEVERDIIIPSLTVRYGISPKASLEAVIPFRYRVDDIFKLSHMDEHDNTPTEEVRSAVGLGDIELALNLDTRLGTEGAPFVTTIGIKTATGLDPYSVPDGKVPLGTGHWGAKLGFTTMKRLDPVMLFGGISYFWNFARYAENYGTVDPGDTVQYSIGMAYALNPRFSLNTRVEQAFTSHSIKDGVVQSGSNMNAATLYLGASYLTERGSAFDFSIGAGLTEDAPDLTVKIGYPIRF